MADQFYITTPIYYVNDKPHIGHAYTTVLADVLARYQRLQGRPTWFLTGTDEHGQKVAAAAAKRGIAPQQHCDEMVLRFQELWKKLDITNDDFIRTTEPRHRQVVQDILQMLFDRGQIYTAEYEGLYSVYEERFFTEKDLVDGLDPIGHRPVERLKETNYFFRMGQYQQWLVDYINRHPDFIQPESRRNETLGFLRQPLADLCISRPKSRLPWGIELPFDPDYVTYVWFDALVNYISAIGYSVQDPGNADFTRWWPATYHLVGKDILTTHTVYWPIMLHAAGVRLPRAVFAHGWWTLPRQDSATVMKISKSSGNAVDPISLADKYGVDAFRYFLMAEMVLGQDAGFTEAQFVLRYTNDLADGFGNMLHRVVKFILAKCDGLVPVPDDTGSRPEDDALRQEALAAVETMATAVAEMRLDRGLQAVMDVVRACNRYFDYNAPWKLYKTGDFARMNAVLYNAAETMRILAGLLHPVMPTKMTAVRQTLGLPNASVPPKIGDLRDWGRLQPGTRVNDPESLFPKFKDEAEGESAVVEAVVPPLAAPPPPPPAALGIVGKSLPPDELADGDASSTVEVVGALPPDRPLSTGMGPRHGLAATPGVTTISPGSLIELEDFRKMKLRTAQIVSAERVTGSDRLLRLQLAVGREHRQVIAGIAEYYTAEQLVGLTVIVVANLRPATIRGLISNGMLLAAQTSSQLRLITVDGDFPSGAVVG